MSSSELFDIDRSASQLPPANQGKTRPQYQQVSCQKANTGSQFPLGVQSYKWSTSDSTWFVPSKSHFVMRITLSDASGSGLVSENTQVAAPTMGMLSNLFQKVEFKIGGKTVSSCSNYVPQIDALIHRTTKSKPYLDSISEADNFWSESFSIRSAEVNNVDVTSDGRRAIAFDLIYKPPLMLFHDYDGSLPPLCDYELLLTPQPESSYKTGLVEFADYGVPGRENPPQPGVDYLFDIDRLEFQLCTIEGPKNADSGTFALQITDIECQSAKIQTSSLSQSYFNVSPATQALVVAYQDTRLSSNNVSRTKFAIAPPTSNQPNNLSQNLAMDLNRLYVQYDSLSRPAPDADPEFVAGAVNRFGQRYRETLDESGMSEDPAGAENYAEWCRRGPYFYFNWNRPMTSGATRVQVNQSFAPGRSPQTNANVLLFSISESSVEVTVKNGSVLSVTKKIGH